MLMTLAFGGSITLLWVLTKGDRQAARKKVEQQNKEREEEARRAEECRRTSEALACPVCNGEMRAGTLRAKADVGVLNFFGGFSIGSRANLKWKDDDAARLDRATRLLSQRKFDGFRCQSCGCIVFDPDGRGRITLGANKALQQPGNDIPAAEA